MTATLTRQETRARKNRARAHARWVPKGSSATDYSPEEIRKRKQAHRDYLRRVLAELESPEGMRRFLIARELHPHLTPLAVAAVAADGVPGVVYRYADGKEGWRHHGRQIARDESAFVFGTRAPSFNPRALFGEGQLVGGEHYDRDDVLAAVGEPCADVVDAARAHLAEILRRGLSPAKTANALCVESGI
ncbi:MAG: hypothetical protein HUU17_06275 [Chthonomonadales bacterium]|nr:hypothetical protein [Chthonomonadales bacterium]